MQLQGRAASLEAGKAQLRETWQKWLAWAKLAELRRTKSELGGSLMKGPKADLRRWAFFGGSVGLLFALCQWLGGVHADAVALLAQVCGFALLGATLAYAKNRIAGE
jgi:hypothetical protein